MRLNIFKLAELQLRRENKAGDLSGLLTRAVKIRKWIDKHRLETAEKILQGDRVYQYGNTIKTYAKA